MNDGTVIDMDELDQDIEASLKHISSILVRAGQTMVAAESCTGGLLAATITDHPGCSAWFKGSFVTYQTSGKVSMLGISKAMLAEHPPVSEEVVLAMVDHSLALTDADYAVALTGIAGPQQDDTDVPVGTLWIGWGSRNDDPRAVKYTIQQDRQTFRHIACAHALRELAAQL